MKDTELIQTALMLTPPWKVAECQFIAKQLLQREIDHLNWARKVGQFQRDEKLVSLDIETDELECAFGKWYYGDERKKAEQEAPETKSFLKQAQGIAQVNIAVTETMSSLTWMMILKISNPPTSIVRYNLLT
jgi:hypothetical protein